MTSWCLAQSWLWRAVLWLDRGRRFPWAATRHHHWVRRQHRFWSGPGRRLDPRVVLRCLLFGNPPEGPPGGGLWSAVRRVAAAGIPVLLVLGTSDWVVWDAMPLGDSGNIHCVRWPDASHLLPVLEPGRLWHVIDCFVRRWTPGKT